jgi:hypothetical protein
MICIAIVRFNPLSVSQSFQRKDELYIIFGFASLLKGLPLGRVGAMSDLGLFERFTKARAVYTLLHDVSGVRKRLSSYFLDKPKANSNCSDGEK